MKFGPLQVASPQVTYGLLDWSQSHVSVTVISVTDNQPEHNDHNDRSRTIMAAAVAHPVDALVPEIENDSDDDFADELEAELVEAGRADDETTLAGNNKKRKETPDADDAPARKAARASETTTGGGSGLASLPREIIAHVFAFLAPRGPHVRRDDVPTPARARSGRQALAKIVRRALRTAQGATPSAQLARAVLRRRREGAATSGRERAAVAEAPVRADAGGEALARGARAERRRGDGAEGRRGTADGRRSRLALARVERPRGRFGREVQAPVQRRDRVLVHAVRVGHIRVRAHGKGARVRRRQLPRTCRGPRRHDRDVRHLRQGVRSHARRGRRTERMRRRGGRKPRKSAGFTGRKGGWGRVSKRGTAENARGKSPATTRRTLQSRTLQTRSPAASERADRLASSAFA